MKPFVEVHSDRIHIEKQTVFRPSGISVSEWETFWGALDKEEVFQRGYHQGYIDGEHDGKDSAQDGAHNEGYNEGHGDGYQEGIRAATTAPHK